MHCIQMHAGAMPYSGANTRTVGLIVHNIERMEYQRCVMGPQGVMVLRHE